MQPLFNAIYACLLLLPVALPSPPFPCTTQQYASGSTCVALTRCTPAQYESAPPTLTSDRSCESPCSANSFLTAPATPTTDIVCSRHMICPTGTIAYSSSICGTMDGVIVGSVSNDVDIVILSTLVTSIGGLLAISDRDDVTALDLHRLSSVGSNLYIDYDPALTVINMRALVTCDGDIGINGNAQLTYVAFPKLLIAPRSVSFVLSNSMRPVAITFDVLEYVFASFTLQPHTTNAAYVSVLSLPRLKYVGLTLTIGTLGLVSRTFVNDVILSALENVGSQYGPTDGIAFSILNTAFLTMVTLPSLNSIGKASEQDLFAVAIVGNVDLLRVDVAPTVTSVYGKAIFCPSRIDFSPVALMQATNGSCSVADSIGSCQTYAPCASAIPVLINPSVDVMAMVNKVDGSLSFINDRTYTQIVVPNLTYISWNFDVVSCLNVTLISFPLLTAVGGEVSIDSDSLVNNIIVAVVSLPRLMYVYSRFRVTNQAVYSRNSTGKNTVLTYIDVSQLRSTGLGFNIVWNSALTVISAPQLTYVAAVGIDGSQLLQTVSFPVLQTIGTSFVLHVAAILSSFELPLLTYVGSSFEILRCGITVLSLPLLTFVASYFEVAGNPSLTMISTLALQSVGTAPFSKANVNVCDNGASFSPPTLLMLSGATLPCSVPVIGSCVDARSCAAFLAPAYSSSFINNASVSDISQYGAIMGSLAFSSSNVTAVLLPQLTYVALGISFVNTSYLTMVAFPSLTLVGGSIVCHNQIYELSVLSFHVLRFVHGDMIFGDGTTPLAALTLLSVPYLDTVLGSFSIIYAPFLALLALPTLTRVQASFIVVDNTFLMLLMTPVLAFVGSDYTLSINPLSDISFASVSFIGNSLLLGNLMDTYSSMTWSSLSSVGGAFAIKQPNNHLMNVLFPVLTCIGSSFELSLQSFLTTIEMSRLEYINSWLDVHQCGEIASFSLPSLTVVNGHIDINTMAALTSIYFPSLTRIMGFLRIDLNPVLAALSMPVVVRIIGQYVDGWTVAICQNSASLVVPANILHAAGRVNFCALGVLCPGPSDYSPCV